MALITGQTVEFVRKPIGEGDNLRASEVRLTFPGPASYDATNGLPFTPDDVQLGRIEGWECTPEVGLADLGAGAVAVVLVAAWSRAASPTTIRIYDLLSHAEIPNTTNVSSFTFYVEIYGARKVISSV